MQKPSSYQEKKEVNTNIFKCGGLTRISLLRDNRSHAPYEVGSNVRQLQTLQSSNEYKIMFSTLIPFLG